MTERARPWLNVVWERNFALEDAADTFYEEAMEKYGEPFEVDRFDGHRVRLYLNSKTLEAHAQLAEAKHDPILLTTMCECGHTVMAHDADDSFHCVVEGCQCPGFERKAE